MTREELSQMVELLRDTAKLHQPNEEILTDVKAESFIFVMDSVLSALSKNKGEGRPKGHWIEVVTGRFPNGEKRTWHYECSACSSGEPPRPINKEHWDFCPNCGADMRGINE